MAKRDYTKIASGSNCPNCGERHLVPIAYGLPSSSTMQLAEQGVVWLGGCIISNDDPQLHCSACDHSVWVDGRTSGPQASTASMT